MKNYLLIKLVSFISDMILI